jgi:hypothetical protein
MGCVTRRGSQRRHTPVMTTRNDYHQIAAELDYMAKELNDAGLPIKAHTLRQPLGAKVPRTRTTATARRNRRRAGRPHQPVGHAHYPEHERGVMAR